MIKAHVKWLKKKNFRFHKEWDPSSFGKMWHLKHTPKNILRRGARRRSFLSSKKNNARERASSIIWGFVNKIEFKGLGVIALKLRQTKIILQINLKTKQICRHNRQFIIVQDCRKGGDLAKKTFGKLRESRTSRKTIPPKHFTSPSAGSQAPIDHRTAKCQRCQGRDRRRRTGCHGSEVVRRNLINYIQIQITHNFSFFWGGGETRALGRKIGSPWHNDVIYNLRQKKTECIYEVIDKTSTRPQIWGCV